jgi:glycosyltransferase involved in cell wall biosynthesis
MLTEDNISVIILTYNEEVHIERCIASVSDLANQIFLVDSYSTDKTCELAESLGAKVYRNKWVNHAIQFNWALDNLPITTDWVFRLDADEIVTESLKKRIVEINTKLKEEVTGIYIRRRMHFMGKWIRNGGMYPIYIMRLFRFGNGYCEQRWMDEHIKLTKGTAIALKGDIIDNNLNNIRWWTGKHSNYALREAIELLNIKFALMPEDGIVPKFTGSQEQRKRWLKVRYASLPLFVRPFLYFIYRYFLKMGFLDGKQGLVWHFLQGFWYRFLVDATLYEIYSNGGIDSNSIKIHLEKDYGIKLS